MNPASDSMQQCRTPEEILVEILRLLPRKSRCRFRCMSKQRCNHLSNHSLMIPKTTKEGLVFQCSDCFKSPTPETTFLRLDNGGGASVNHCISYNKTGYNVDDKYRICDSCNGSLLLHNRFIGVEPKHLVYNPITKFLEHVARPTSRPFDVVGLIFDDNHFKVTSYSGSAIESRFVFYVYPLEDKKWSRKELESPHGDARPRRPLFFKSAVHWILRKHLLVYHLQDEFCRFVELPSINDEAYHVQKHIWAFEGRLHYCTVKGKRVDIWVLYVEEHSYVPGKQCLEWQHKHTGVLSLRDCFHSSPFAFNDDFVILDLQFNNEVISYIPETGEANGAYVCPKDGESLDHLRHGGFPFLYTSD